MIKRQRIETLKNLTANSTTTVSNRTPVGNSNAKVKVNGNPTVKVNVIQSTQITNHEMLKNQKQVKAQPVNEVDIAKGFDISDLKSRLPSSSNAKVNAKTMFNSGVASVGTEKTKSKPVGQITKTKKGRGKGKGVGRPRKQAIEEKQEETTTPAAEKQEQTEDSGHLIKQKPGLNFNKRLTRFKAKKLQEEKEKMAKEEELKLQQEFELKKKEKELVLKKESKKQNLKSQKVTKSKRKGQTPAPPPVNPPPPNLKSEAAQPDKSEIQVPQSDPPEPVHNHIPNHIIESDIIESSSQHIESSHQPPPPLPPVTVAAEKKLSIKTHANAVVESFNDTTTTTNDNDFFSNADFNNTTGIDQTTIHESTRIESTDSKQVPTGDAVTVLTNGSAILGNSQQVETKHPEMDAKQQLVAINKKEDQQKVVETSKTKTNAKYGKVSRKRKGKVYKKMKRDTRSRTQRSAAAKTETEQSVVDNQTPIVEKETPTETSTDQADKTNLTNQHNTPIPNQKSIPDPKPQPMTSNNPQENIPGHSPDPVQPLVDDDKLNNNILQGLNGFQDYISGEIEQVSKLVHNNKSVSSNQPPSLPQQHQQQHNPIATTNHNTVVSAPSNNNLLNTNRSTNITPLDQQITASSSMLDVLNVLLKDVTQRMEMVENVISNKHQQLRLELDKKFQDLHDEHRSKMNGFLSQTQTNLQNIISSESRLFDCISKDY
ncbi:unnamed protein product [Ambrosiozyma monospora]|uniref:Unnamed protein product n=1 Tax=Ambrosiozyma monospora TaxID=43982 RepID=A0ACB5SU46_AMBMO|nr:unnamed protein product [Ambrosiozyma monospora]